ncbi:MAG: class I SAM-dependent methyltransferase, partial [Pseudomonadota bacterium]
VLDCGVGDGAFSRALFDATGRTFELAAVDLSGVMLSEAERNLAARGLKASFHQADARDLPFGEDMFDLVITAQMLEHIADAPTALKEMTRVLKPGGLLVASMTRRSWFGRIIQFGWRTHAVAQGHALAWFRAQNLKDVRCLPPTNHALFDRLSLVCVGRKPNTQQVAHNRPIGDFDQGDEHAR